jgi:hypothetical protein
MSKDWQDQAELVLDGSLCPVEHHPSVPPGFAVEVWIRDGGSCSHCQNPGQRVIPVSDKDSNKFELVCEVHDWT